MAKKNFSAGTTKSGVLNNDGGEKLREIQAKTQYNFKYIPKDKIIPNPKNEQYSQDGIEALKESILVNGLRHNLSVLYDAETDLYRLISGERRYHAICQMTDKEYRNNFPAGIPCKIEKSDISAIDEEIMLISANHDVRESNMEVKRWEVSRLLELYEAKKLKGEIKNIHAEIASQLNISERQARKYTTAEKLIPELSELLNNNGIDLNQIIAIIASQIRLLFQVKRLYNSGKSNDEIAKILEFKSVYRVKYLLSDSYYYSEDTLIKYLSKLSNIDRDIKINNIDGNILLELFIAGKDY